MHHITPEVLRHAFYSLRRNAAAGIDEVTWKDYRKKLETRLPKLYKQVQDGTYRATPSKRTWIPKPDGRKRPLGITITEDKIVQQALVYVMMCIYEVDFLGFSYGFRPGKSQHNALDALYVAITRGKVDWILDADIKSFFDTLDHKWMMRFLKHRIGDKRILRLIRKFLRAGVSEKGEWSKATVGTPQGAVISPLLANIYLHYVLDLWVQVWRKRQARGEVYIVRYADDFVVCFQNKTDGERFLRALKDRLQKFELTLHPEKTRLIEFGRYAASNREKRGSGKPETFDFLGFTHVCSKRKSNGSFIVRRKTVKKRLRAKIKEARQALAEIMHSPLPEQGQWLKSVIRGHMNYYSVPGNRKTVDCFRSEMCRAWLRTLRRRSQKGKVLKWDKMKRLIAKWIPSTKTVHPYPTQRFCVWTQGRSRMR
jgi:group II intron reverse transcriptase/maturase